MSLRRVVFDGRWLVAPVPSGIRWLHSMLPALARARPDVEVVAMAPPGGDVGPLEEGGCRVVEHRRAALPGPVAAVWLDRMAARLQADVAVSQFFGPWRRTPTPHVVVVHDALWTSHPEWFDPWPRALLSLVGPSLRGSTVMTVSSSAARQVAHAGLAPRPEVVPNGVDLPDPAACLPRHDRAGGLVVARPDVRKNLVTAVHAWQAADTDEPLRIVGASRDEVAALAGHLPAQVEVLGRVAADELSAAYGRARVVLAPSLGEGFSLPPLEAMAHGTPVIASDIDVHRELYADVAVLVPPLQPEAWAEAIGYLAADEAEATRRASEGLDLARQLTWDRAAERFAALLDRVARRG